MALAIFICQCIRSRPLAGLSCVAIDDPKDASLANVSEDVKRELEDPDSKVIELNLSQINAEIIFSRHHYGGQMKNTALAWSYGREANGKLG
nr:hypothetical protein Iba_chr11fCG5800 [Ipomoea batatas]